MEIILHHLCCHNGELSESIVPYLPVYYAEMLALPEDRPDVYQVFSAGQFSVQLSGLNPFEQIPVEQATKFTVNKEACVKSNKWNLVVE